MATKYVVFDNQIAVIFSDLLTHRDVAERLARLALDGKVTGAGFVDIREDQIYISGRSESLNKDPGKNDEKAIRRTLGLPIQ